MESDYPITISVSQTASPKKAGFDHLFQKNSKPQISTTVDYTEKYEEPVRLWRNVVKQEK